MAIDTPPLAIRAAQLGVLVYKALRGQEICQRGKVAMLTSRARRRHTCQGIARGAQYMHDGIGERLCGKRAGRFYHKARF